MIYLGLVNGAFLLRWTLGRAPRVAVAAYWALLVGLFLFSAFRLNVGCDWAGYAINYIDAMAMDYRDALAGKEPLYWAFLVGMTRWGWIYPILNVVSSAVFFAGLHTLARRQPDPLGFLVLTVPILVIAMPMSALRQGMAIGVMCWAFCAFLDRRPVRFAAIVLLASTIHTSAAAFMLMLPLATGRTTALRLAATAILAVPATLYLAGTEAVQDAVDSYVDGREEAAGAVFRAAALCLSGLFFLPLAPYWRRAFPGDYDLARIGAALMLAMLPMVSYSTVVPDRYGYYLIPIQIMIFARLPFLPMRRSTRWIAALPYAGYLLLFTVWSTSSTLFDICFVPYQSWLLRSPGDTLAEFEDWW